MPRVVCMNCQKFYHPKRNGVVVEEGMPLGRGDNVQWAPYKLWRADLLECRQCGHTIAAGFGFAAFAEHYESDYDMKKQALSPVAFVEDCM